MREQAGGECLVANAEEILNGPDYFTCEKFGTRMPKRDCVKRQKRRHAVYSPWIETSIVEMSLDKCQDCEQGKEIMEEVADIGEVTEGRGQLKNWRRRKPKDFTKIMEELGFDKEREMFECLLKDWSQPTVADLVGCSKATVQNRAEKYRIQCAKPGRRKARGRMTEDRPATVAAGKDQEAHDEEQAEVTTKICNRCGEEKPLDDFYKHPSGKHGHTAICKECRRAHDREHKRKQYAEFRLLKEMEDKDQENVSRVKELIEEHWKYIENLLRAHNTTTCDMKGIEYHYKTAFMHGYKHALEDHGNHSARH